MVSITKHELPPLDVKAEFDVIEIEPHKFRGVKPLAKPSKLTRGAYGGNIVAQAILVAIRSSPASRSFVPNSIHSYFIKAVSDQTPMVWEVEEITTGRTFVHRYVRGLQDGSIVFTAMVSLTSNNSTKNNNGKDVSSLNFSIPATNTMQQDIKDLPVVYHIDPLFAFQKIYPFQNDPENVTFLIRWGITDDKQYNQPLINLSEEFKYVGFTSLTDWIAMELLLPHIDIDVRPRVEASIDHNIHYHDDDFQVDQWFVYVLNLKWVGHDRALIKGDIFTLEGKKHIATIVQERLFITSPKI
ncbi:hypothetical protein LELG_00984 [Lodderomyces elongisporus NRRL YB-4239]|uniref:Acyl-CoA thioesterase II n=1 Tax=Lodderomyces elongisporus (strain ATCC 11503 / CBS 2605 / JCM 1781 / NBRC 1676 / NRRL YB-4239) TaxID=379508 RepID=A5DUE8_LODEL|nr:hypothetical protein LELG_00984 [Lodderomyces elongisporus NRRL YB-4239]